jgi:hypothetical protein
LFNNSQPNFNENKRITHVCSVQFEPVQIQFLKFLSCPNCELELTSRVWTRTGTVTELSVRFCQFGPNWWFGTELRQRYF